MQRHFLKTTGLTYKHFTLIAAGAEGDGAAAHGPAGGRCRLRARLCRPGAHDQFAQGDHGADAGRDRPQRRRLKVVGFLQSRRDRARVRRGVISNPNTESTKCPPSPPSRSTFPTPSSQDLKTRLASTVLPSEVESHGWSAGPTNAYVRALHRPAAERLRLARRGSRDQPASAVHDRDRRPDHPLHPRQVGGEERHAAAADPRLAGIDRRVPRRHRAADQSGRAWRQGRGCLRRRHPLAPRLRLFRPDPRGRLEQRAGSPAAFIELMGRLGYAALRRAGRRRRRDHRPRDRPRSRRTG